MKRNLRIVFMGTPDFAVPSLKILVDNGFDITAVVTVPDKKAGRGQQLSTSPVKHYAEQKGLKVLQPLKLKDENFINELSALNANLFIVVAFRMLPETVWKMPEFGTFNLHSSLLPDYRGAAPINWAIINGETQSGVTTFFLKHQIDTGDIIDQKIVEIGPNETAGELHDKLMIIGANLVLETCRKIQNDSVKTYPQEEKEEQKEAPKIFKEDCKIDWNKPAQEVHNFIRGLSPYPAAWTELYGSGEPNSIKIFESRIDTLVDRPLQAGTFLLTEKSITVFCKDGALNILSLQLAGKKRMDTSDFVRGFNLNGCWFN